MRRPSPARFPLIRPPSARAVVAVVAALLAALLVQRLSSTAAAATARYGETTTVWVATHDLAPGDVVDDAALARQERPVAFVAAGAVHDPVGRTVRQPIFAGEVVVTERLGGSDRTGPAALVPEGWRGVAVPVYDAEMPVRTGDRVDVVAAFDPSLGPPEPALVLVSDAIVVHVDDEATATVAVPGERVPAVALALVTGVVTLALVP